MLVTMPRAATAPPASFEGDTSRALTAVRKAYSAAVKAIDPAIQTGSDLQRATRLDMKLCWKVMRIVQSAEPLAAAPFVLGPDNAAAFCRMLARKDVPASVVEKIRVADARLEELVREHAGDRRTFESMVAGWAGGRKDLAPRKRRAAFAPNCDVWGMSAELLACCGAIRRSAQSPDRLDILALNAEFGMQRLRQTRLPLYLRRSFLGSTAAENRTETTRRPLGRNCSAEEPLGLIEEFSSRPIPALNVHPDSDGALTVTLAHDRVGSKAAIDLALGFVDMGVARPEPPAFLVHGIQVRKPVKLAVVDLLVERGCFDTSQTRACMAPTHAMFPPTRREFEVHGSFDDAAAPTALSGDWDALRHSHAERYGELVQWAFERQRWDVRDFVVLRYAVEYPVPMSTLAVYL